MKLVIQRVTRGKVTVNNQIVGQIENGYVILVGFKEEDSNEQVELLTKKMLNMRIMSDDNDKMNRSIIDVHGELLLIPQFTLYADTKKRRPSFSKAAKPEKAENLFRFFVEEVKKGKLKTEIGEFGAKMAVELTNDGPVTIVLEN